MPDFACAITTVWCGRASFAILKLIDLTIGRSLTRETDIEGRDVRLHGEAMP